MNIECEQPVEVKNNNLVSIIRHVISLINYSKRTVLKVIYMYEKNEFE